MKYKVGDVVYRSNKQEWMIIDDVWEQGYTGNKIVTYIDPLDMLSYPESATQFCYENQIDHNITELLGHVIVDRIKTYILGWNESMEEIDEIVKARKVK
jgi:hypothetical protein